VHDLFSALASWITSVVEGGGYVGIAGLTLLENLLPPIPSELVLPVAGYLVGQGRLAFPLVVLAATIGSVAGALLLYWLGHRLGEDRLRRLVRDYGRWALLKEEDVDRSQKWFDEHGGVTVLVGRLIPTARSIVSIPAGIDRMPLPRFILYTTLGSALWNAALVAAGWLLGSQWERLSPIMDVLEWGGLLAIAAAVAWLVWQRKIKPQQSRHSPAA
jgi:membrane protein DedA with SNARE-associated domain